MGCHIDEAATLSGTDEAAATRRRCEDGGVVCGCDGDGKLEATVAVESQGRARADEGDIGLPGPMRMVRLGRTAHGLAVSNGWLRCTSSLPLHFLSNVSRVPLESAATGDSAYFCRVPCEHEWVLETP